MTRFLLLLTLACGSAPLEPTAVKHSAPATCEVRVSPDSNVGGDTLTAIHRLQAATGCQVVIDPAGVPIQLGIIGESDGNRIACGLSHFDWDENQVVTARGAVMVSAYYWSQCEWPVDRIIEHELMHELINEPGRVVDLTHAASGLFQLSEVPADMLLDEASLEHFCERADCQAFNPEL